MAATGYQTERLDHLGIVAGVCREIGLATYLDAFDEQQHERVSVGTAVVAMILNGLGFSNRQLYLVPQFFANKPVEHLLGSGITAEDLNDDCLGGPRIDCTSTTRRRCSPASPPALAGCLGCKRASCTRTRPRSRSVGRTSRRRATWMRKLSPSPTVTRGTTGRISNSGCSEWSLPTTGMCPWAYRRWMATPAIR
jgi:hypothetical protein